MKIEKEYSYVILTGLLINLHAFSQGFKIGSMRRKIFNQDFMQKQFGSTHQSQLNEQIQPGGYPDTGSGIYSQRLSYKDWYKFNVLQRIHLNYLQNLPLTLTGLFAAGIFKPIHASVIGFIYFLMRVLYSKFYQQQGGAMNIFRRIGAGGAFITGLVNLFIAGYYAIKTLRN